LIYEICGLWNIFAAYATNLSEKTFFAALSTREKNYYFREEAEI